MKKNIIIISLNILFIVWQSKHIADVNLITDGLPISVVCAVVEFDAVSAIYNNNGIAKIKEIIIIFFFMEKLLSV
jgi:hypothetical protein